jgi:hypothetical protein
MNLIADTIATNLETIGDLETVTNSPTGDIGYGSDLDCTDDVTSTFTELDGVKDGPIIVAQACYRRLITPRNSLAVLDDDPDYGYDIASLLHRGMTPQALVGAEGAIRNELLKDDRIDQLDVALTQETSGESNAYDLEISGTLVDSKETFSLTMALTDSVVLLREIGR